MQKVLTSAWLAPQQTLHAVPNTPSWVCFADQALQSVDKQLPPSTRGTRSKRQRSAKAWLGTDENDENDAQAANTPVVRPTTAKKLRIFGPTPTAGKTTVQREAARSTVKKEFGKSAIKQEVKMFVLVLVLATAFACTFAPQALIDQEQYAYTDCKLLISL